jgi:hypothetical protein
LLFRAVSRRQRLRRSLWELRTAQQAAGPLRTGRSTMRPFTTVTAPSAALSGRGPDDLADPLAFRVRRGERTLIDGS